MNDTAIKNFAVWARRQLIEDVKQQMAKWAIDEQGSVPATADVLNGNVLTPQQREQRAELLRLCKVKGTEQLAEQAAYTWFNRFLAIRFMELHDYLPCGLRFFSSAGGAFDPQVLKEALRVEIEGLDRNQVLTAIREGDEPLFRTLFIAQCNELADCMHAVFEHVGSAMELLLPDNLLRDGGVLSHMVLDIPESDWLEGVEIVGWMYQYYVSERKNEVFASFKKGKKAERDAIAPATQLFTPHWIVRYLTENSLGRLWMLNHPDSHLVDSMDYYIAPDADGREDVLSIASPEEITVCDPACGSGHILVYTFDVLAAIYDECGYMRRDIPRLILEKNLAGMEIDPRAAAMASFALTMKAMEWDSRFLSRGVSPDITVLQPVTFEAEELEKYPQLAEQQHVLEITAHMDECGSLFVPKSTDIVTLESIKSDIRNDVDIFTSDTADKIQRIIDLFKSLARTFTVVVANPPYMGSSNMDKWTADFTKKNYPDSKRDLCTCFIERGYSLVKPAGYAAMVTMQSWMFLGSFEQFRENLINNKSIVSMAHIGARGFDSIGGEVVSTTATVLLNHHAAMKGDYVRLVDEIGEQSKSEKTLEAIANPNCGWFYQADADTFKDIPGTPLAYWISERMIQCFHKGSPLGSYYIARQGMHTCNNDKWLRMWWEILNEDFSHGFSSERDCEDSIKSWFSYNKGGQYRKWGGNDEYVVYFKGNGEALRLDDKACGFNGEYAFRPSLTWSSISSGKPAFRLKSEGYLFDAAGYSMFPVADLSFEEACGFANCSVAEHMLQFLSPTLNFQSGDILSLPIIMGDKHTRKKINALVADCCAISASDWNSCELAWEFKGSGLLRRNESWCGF